jgi:hypothetical protein
MLFFSGVIASITTSLGTGLITAGIVTFILQHLAYRQTLEMKDHQTDLRRAIQTSLRSMKSGSPSDIDAVYDNLSGLLTNYSSIISSVKSRVDILGANLVPLSWIPAFDSATTEALKRGVLFRLMFLDPHSESVRSFSREERGSEDFLRRDLTRSLQKWEELSHRREWRGQVKVAMSDKLPNLFLLITDERLFFAPFPRSEAIAPLPCFEISSSSRGLFGRLLNYYETLWLESRQFAF